MTLSEQSISLECIETNIYLGNFAAAKDKNLLNEKNIRFILTVNSFPLPKEIVALNQVYTKYIKVFDTSRDDLLSNFEETYDFIERSSEKGAVLIHCFHGVSRSPTIVMSYLMKKKSLTMSEALAYVRAKKKSVGPNPGFLAQLKLYEMMHCTLDKNNVQYKMFRLYVTVEYMKKENAIPEFCSDVIKPDPLLTTNSDLSVYKCQKCRRVLAHNCNVIPHLPKEKYSWRNSRWSECLSSSEICHLFYFIEPLAWMQNVGNSLEGKIYCPNSTCKSKLGSFSWVTGCQCPCGTHVRPGFYLIPSKVDRAYFILLPTRFSNSVNSNQHCEKCFSLCCKLKHRP